MFVLCTHITHAQTNLNAWKTDGKLMNSRNRIRLIRFLFDLICPCFSWSDSQLVTNPTDRQLFFQSVWLSAARSLANAFPRIEFELFALMADVCVCVCVRIYNTNFMFWLFNVILSHWQQPMSGHLLSKPVFCVSRILLFLFCLGQLHLLWSQRRPNVTAVPVFRMHQHWSFFGHHSHVHRE